MKNKIYLKQSIIKNIIISVLFILILTTINRIEYKKYTLEYNKKISSLVATMQEKYPEITD